jgi:hypothetical protein
MAANPLAMHCRGASVTHICPPASEAACATPDVAWQQPPCCSSPPACYACAACVPPGGQPWACQWGLAEAPPPGEIKATPLLVSSRARPDTAPFLRGAWRYRTSDWRGLAASDASRCCPECPAPTCLKQGLAAAISPSASCLAEPGSIPPACSASCRVPRARRPCGSSLLVAWVMPGSSLPALVTPCGAWPQPNCLCCASSSRQRVVAQRAGPGGSPWPVSRRAGLAAAPGLCRPTCGAWRQPLPGSWAVPHVFPTVSPGNNRFLPGVPRQTWQRG